MEDKKMFLLLSLVLGVSIVLGLIIAWIVMLLFPELTYWQSFELYMLFTVLFINTRYIYKYLS